jgi:cephalosporin-C deacetylase-like acetyl esterase
MFNDPDAQPPMSRRATYGFRRVKYLSEVPAPLLDTAESARREYGKEKPVAEGVFSMYRSFYSYDKTKLEPVVESMDDASEYWRTEEIARNTAYGGERLTIHLFLPRSVEPPCQTVVFFPGSSALRSRSFKRSVQTASFDFLVRSGRAVAYPVYRSTYERGDGLLSDRPNMSGNYRDHVIQPYKDFARCVDYLETRKDPDTRRLGYYGFSWGAVMAPIVLASAPEA